MARRPIDTRAPAGLALALPLPLPLALGACGAPDDERDPCSHEVCAIDDPSCVEQISLTMACKLGVEPIELPDVRMVTAAQLVAELEAEAEADPLTAAELEDIDDYYRGQALVGLMPEGFHDSPATTNIADWAVAYYALDDREIVVITDNLDGDPESAYLVMTHEMVHVYQDARLDLRALQDDHASTYDRFLGLRAAIEGEATIYNLLADIELRDLLPSQIDWDRYFAEFQADMLAEAMTTEEPALDAVALFPYAFGSEFMFDARDDEGRTSIDAVFAQPPDSVRQVLGGYATWPDDLQNRDDLLDDHAAPLLPERYTFLGGGHEGTWLINAMIHATTTNTDPWPSLALDDVSADYLSIFRDEDSGEIVTIWRIQLANAQRLRDVLLTVGSRWTDATDADPITHLFTTLDDDVILLATTGPDVALVAAELAGWGSLDALGDPRGDDRARLDLRAARGRERGRLGAAHCEVPSSPRAR